MAGVCLMGSFGQDRGQWRAHINNGNETSRSIKCDEFLAQ